MGAHDVSYHIDFFVACRLRIGVDKQLELAAVRAAVKVFCDAADDDDELVILSSSSSSLQSTGVGQHLDTVRYDCTGASLDNGSLRRQR